MPSRRRRRSKNLGTNLAEVQRRLRYLERRPVRTKLQRNVVTTAAIAVNAVTQDEVSFGTTVITDAPTNTIENPKDGLLVINETAGTTSVYSQDQETYIQLPAVDTDARDAAGSAQTTADGKNTIYRQTNQPTGTFAVGDLWFDTDDDNKMYRWTGSAWGGFTLGNNALASISANKITAGTIDASVITVSNLNAGNISTGNLSAARIATTALNADNITAGTITGILIRTGPSGRRIEVTAQDDVVFYGSSGRTGTITSVGGTWSGGTGDGDPGYSINAGVMIYGGAAEVDQGAETYPSLVATATQVNMYGASGTRFQAAADGLGMYGPKGYIYPDITTIYTGYSQTGAEYWHLYLQGRLRLSENSEGPLSAGAGAPTTDGKLTGQVCFRYTA